MAHDAERFLRVIQLEGDFHTSDVQFRLTRLVIIFVCRRCYRVTPAVQMLFELLRQDEWKMKFLRIHSIHTVTTFIEWNNAWSHIHRVLSWNKPPIIFHGDIIQG